MSSIAHIINLFQAPTSSDLRLAQEVTIQSMINAKEQTSSKTKVVLLSAQTKEDLHIVPKSFKATRCLDRDIRDLTNLQQPRALPILKDILDRLYEESTAEYLIYTNVDIGIQPQFYDFVQETIDQGLDAFIINRRRIPARFTSVVELDSMLKEKGFKHPGFDCFIFHRNLYPKFSLAEICIGVPFIGIGLAQNIFCFAQRPVVFPDEYLTFHIGTELLLGGRAPREYFKYNQRQFWTAMKKIWPSLNTRKWPLGNHWLPIRMIYWGLHPSLPIRLALKLEPRRWFS